MKPKSTLRFFLAISSSTLLAISYTQADTQYWSADGVAQGGTTGTWSSSFWGAAATGPFAAAWVDNNTAVFGGTAGTVSLTADVTVGGLQFNTTAYVLASDSATSKTLNFVSGDNTILFNNIAAASTPTGGTAGLKLGGTGNVILTTSTPAAGGTLTLNYAVAGQHSIGWSGTTTINPGMTMALTGRDLSLSSTTGITLNGGGITLTNSNSTQGAFDRVSNAGITSNGGTITYTNTSGASNNYTETIGTPVLTTGQLNMVLTNSQAGSQILTLGGLTRAGAANTSSVAFAAGGGLNATTSQIVVSGKTAGFIGPWATCGTAIAANSLSDYAVYNGSAQVVPANIAATLEDNPSWIAGANVTLSAATTLTNTRTVNTLRYTGGTGNVDLGGFSLETNGFLSGGSGAPTITNGTLTTPSGGGSLYLALSRNMTVSAPINDNGGAVTVVQTGFGQLTLSSTTSDFSGGIVLNAGTLVTTADTNLGATSNAITVNGNASWNGGAVTYARDVTINEGAVLNMSGPSLFTISGVVSGSGTLRNAGSNNEYSLTNTGNTFTGILYNDHIMQVASLGDSSNAINLSGSNANFVWTGGTKDFALRPFTINGSGGTYGGGYIANSGSGALTIQQSLVVSGAAAARTLNLGGTYTGAANTFSGKIGNGTDGTGSVVSLTKRDAGTWSLTNTANSYTGATRVSNGTLSVNSIGSVNGGSSALGNPSSSANGRIIMGNGTETGTLEYTGAGNTSDREIQINSATGTDKGGAIILNNGAGTLTFTAPTFNAAYTNGSLVSRPLTLGGSNGGEVQGVIQDNSATNNVGVIKTGTGIWTLTNSSNSYTGTTTVRGGVLKLGQATALPGGIGSSGGDSNLTLTTGGVVGLPADFSRTPGTGVDQVKWTGSGGFAAYGANRTVDLGSTQNWDAGSFVPTGDSLILSAADADGTLIWASGFSFAGSQRTIQVNNGSAAVDAQITAVLSGGTSSGLNKTGTGTLELTNSSNSYSGSTTVAEGTLRLGASNVLPDTTDVTKLVTIAAATLDVGAGVTDSTGMARLDVTAAATINLGDSISKLVFADSNGVDWTDTDPDGTLNITGAFVSGSSIKFATSGGLSAGQLASITLNGSPATFSLDGSGFLVSGGGPVGFAAWQAANSTAQTADLDHDNDGVSNGVEFFIGGTNDTTGFTLLPSVNTVGGLSVTWTKHPTYTGSYGSGYVVETSATLTGPWATEPDPGPTISFPTADEVKYTFPTPLGTRNFARLKVTVP